MYWENCEGVEEFIKGGVLEFGEIIRFGVLVISIQNGKRNIYFIICLLIMCFHHNIILVTIFENII